MTVQKIVTFLTFDGRAEEAVNHYTSIFKNSRIVSTSRYPEGGPAPVGSLMSAEFELEGQPFFALNGGPSFTFSQGISLYVGCETQEEIDHLWDRLTEGGGEPGPCGWLTDRFGVSWQIIPHVLGELLGGPDQDRAQRAMKVMLEMSKLDIKALEEA